MVGYDFDKTIYDGDSFTDFYFFCLLKRPYLFLIIPFQFIIFIFTFYNRKYAKQGFAIYLCLINAKNLINLFWDKNIVKIKSWYLAQKKADDIIASASPIFLLEPICKKLNIKYLIATNMNIKNGIIKNCNCYGKYKVSEYLKLFTASQITAFYSDSLSDLPMFKLAKNGFLVKKNLIEKYKEI